MARFGWCQAPRRPGSRWRGSQPAQGLIEASDREIEDEIRAEGKEPDASAEQLRARLLELTAELRAQLHARKERQRREPMEREDAASQNDEGE